MTNNTKERFKQTYTISFFLTCDSESCIPKKHEEALEEDAKERIFSQIAEGNYSGEIVTSVRFGKDEVEEEDEEEGLSYSGWWSLVKN